MKRYYTGVAEMGCNFLYSSSEAIDFAAGLHATLHLKRLYPDRNHPLDSAHFGVKTNVSTSPATAMRFLYWRFVFWRQTSTGNLLDYLARRTGMCCNFTTSDLLPAKNIDGYIWKPSSPPKQAQMELSMP